jgi:hypothetical protein
MEGRVHDNRHFSVKRGKWRSDAPEFSKKRANPCGPIDPATTVTLQREIVAAVPQPRTDAGKNDRNDRCFDRPWKRPVNALTPTPPTAANMVIFLL